MSWPASILDDDWEDARPQFTPATIGVPEVNVTAATNLFTMCEGWNFSKLPLTQSQKQRLNRLARRDGNLSLCQHDIARGVSAEELRSGDGEFPGTDVYHGPGRRPPDVLAALREQA